MQRNLLKCIIGFHSLLHISHYLISHYLISHYLISHYLISHYLISHYLISHYLLILYCPSCILTTLVYIKRWLVVYYKWSKWYKMANGSQYYRALESVSIASALSSALTIYPCQIWVHQRYNSLNSRLLTAQQKEWWPATSDSLPVNTVIHTTLAGIEPTDC